MNKRIKLKKNVFGKYCDHRCVYYRVIIAEKLPTNNCCTGCKYKHISSEIVRNNLKAVE